MDSNFLLQATIHELLPQVKAKHGLKFQVKGDKFLYYQKTAFSKDNSKDDRWVYSQDDVFYLSDFHFEPNYKPIPYIENAKQLRQILVGLSEVLGKTKHEYKPILITKAQALDDSWFRSVEKDSKYTGLCLFNCQPETVLQELIEILENLLK